VCTNPNGIMSDISLQFRRAHDMNMVIEVTETDSMIMATFSDRTRSFIIDAVVKHLTIKYGTHVFVARNSLNPKVVEVWSRENVT
jgi:hypothetical protein